MRVWSGLCLCVVMGSAIDASTWIEARSPRFVIVTDAGEAAARRLVTRLEQFDGAIAHTAGSSGAFSRLDAPLRIYLFQSEREFGEFRDRDGIAGLTVSSGGAPWILLFDGPRVRDIVIHEYVHALVARGDWKLPHWFEEGLAELYGHAVPTGGDQLSLGRQVPEYMAELRNQTLTAGLLIEDAANAGSRARFYATSWALVTMMLIEPRYRSRVEQLLTRGDWDSSFPELLRDLQAYVARPIWKEVEVSAPVPAAIELGVRKMTPLDAEFMLAGLLLDAGRAEAARKHYQRIAASHPGGAASAEASGLVALAEGRAEAAAELLQRAADLGSTRARVWFELATLRREEGKAWEQVRGLLEQAARLDPADYQAAFLLGVRLSDDGKWQEAVAALSAAANAAPGRSDVWHAYAVALGRAGRVAEARVAARRAVRVASSQEAERMATDLVASLDEPLSSAPAVRRRPEVITSPAWSRPTPDAYVEGRFLEFVCQAEPPRFRVEDADGRVVELKMSDPKQVSGVQIELACGLQPGRKMVRIGYRKADREVLEVQFPAQE